MIYTEGKLPIIVRAKIVPKLSNYKSLRLIIGFNRRLF